MADLIWGSDPCKSLELGRQKPRPSALVTKKTHGGDDDDDDHHHHHHDHHHHQVPVSISKTTAKLIPMNYDHGGGSEVLNALQKLICT